ncbi:MAG: DUF4363 family protein [Oscillospiraceae bacterium]
MSRLIIIICVTLGIFVMGTISILDVKDFSEDVSDTIFVAVEACNKKEKAKLKDEIEKLSTIWEKRQKTLNYYIHHDELESISKLIATLKSFYDSEDYSLASEKLLEIKYLALHIYEEELPNAKNLF